MLPYFLLLCSILCLSSAVARTSSFQNGLSSNLLDTLNLPESEIAALQDLYTATGGDAWTWKSAGEPWNFSTTANPCVGDWQGVNCTTVPTDGYLHVRALSLQNYSLTGSLPDSMGNFAVLEQLYLQTNVLIGTIPESLYQLTNLSILDLSNNQLLGNLSNAIGNLHSLTSLVLVENQLTGSVPATVSALSVLASLSLSGNHFSSDLTSLCGIDALVSLDLQNNLFSSTIPDCFSSLLYLKSLNIGNNGISGPLPVWMGTAGTTPSLQTLILNVSLQLFGPFPPFFSNLSSLVYLDLSASELTGTLPDGFWSTLTSLQHFDVSYNHLEGQLPDFAGDLPSLAMVKLGYNWLNGTIPSFPGFLTGLSSIDLGGNFITGTLTQAVCDVLSLQTVFFEDNFLTGTVPVCLTQLHNLTYLKLSTNQFTGTIPAVLATLPKGAQLDLSYNSLGGTIPQIFTSPLQSITLNNNALTGTIPASLTALPTLWQVDLAFNHLRGSIPQNIAPSVRSLQLNNNQMTGSIPTAVAAMNTLLALNLNNNQLSGSLDGLFNASTQLYLNTVVLQNNQLIGTLPDQLLALPSLSYLVASSNCFHGTLPSTVCAGSALRVLVLDGLSSASACRHRLVPDITSTYTLTESVGGTIPSCVYAMPSMNFLQLSGNRLSGSLPLNVDISADLVALSVSHNALTGSIPAAFLSRAWLSLDLSYNKLTGTLGHNKLTGAVSTEDPFSGTGVVSLFLENNRISGDIPASLRNVKNISILDTNLFSCRLDGRDLPDNDPSAGNYQCSSTEFDIPYYLWLGLAFAVCATTAVLALVNYDHPSLQTLRMCRAELTSQVSSGPSHLRTVCNTMDGVCKVSTAGAAYAVLVLLPMYAILSLFYGTLSYSYAWTVSAAYLSGAGAMCTEMVLWLFLPCCAPLVMRIRDLRVNRPHTGPSSASGVSSYLLITVSFLLLNCAVVVGVNVVYVYVAIYQSTGLLIFFQIVLAVFKFCWSHVVMEHYLRRLIGYFSGKSDSPSALHSSAYTSLTVAASLINNVVIPCVVVALINPNCFYNALVPAQKVNYVYFYSLCLVYNADGCQSAEGDIQVDSYNPPFTYSYQCSSSLITYYAPAFVNLCIVSTFVAPLTQLIAQRLHQRASAGTRWFRLLDYVLPRILKPIPSASHVNGTGCVLHHSYFKPNRVLINLITYLGLLLTFGVVFPPLAVALAVAVVAVAVVDKLRLGRFLCAARETQRLTEYLANIERECEVVNAPAVLHNSLWMLVTMSCWFYTLFLFDTLGDAVGFGGAYWVLIVMPLLPLVLYGTYTAQLMRHSAALEDSPSTERSVSLSAGVELYDKTVESGVVNALHEI